MERIKLKLKILIGLEAIGFFWIITSILYEYGGPPSAIPVTSLEYFKLIIYYSPFLFWIEFGPLFVFFLAVAGAILSWKFFHSPHKNLAVWGFTLSIIDLILSLFISYLLFMLAIDM